MSDLEENYVRFLAYCSRIPTGNVDDKNEKTKKNKEIHYFKTDLLFTLLVQSKRLNKTNEIHDFGPIQKCLSYLFRKPLRLRTIINKYIKYRIIFAIIIL